MRSIVRCGAAAAGLFTGLAALAQNGDGPARTTVLVVERVPLDKVLVDAKDKRLGDALAMLPARVRELPHEFPDLPPEAASVAHLVMSTVARPASLVLTYDPDNPEGVGFGYGLVISFGMKDKQDAEQLHAQIGGMIAAAGPEMPSQPSERWPGMVEFTLPVGPLSYGPRESQRGWRYEVVVGHVTDPDAGLDALPAADSGVSPVLRGRFDFSGLTPVMSMAQMFAGGEPEAAWFLEGMKEAGFWGSGAVKVEFVVGHTKDEGVVTTRFRGAQRFAEAWHTSAEPLSSADLGAVPADAVWAGIGRGDLAWVEDLITQLAEMNPEAVEGLDQFAQQTGVDLKEDVLATLGGTMGFYTSDATGGGSLASAVGLITFKDRAKFMEAHGKLLAFANAMAEQIPPPMTGHVRVTSWKEGDLELFSVRFPGLPVPLEPTWAATDKWLVVGGTPQAAVAAARQVTGKGDKGLASSAAFSAVMPKGVQPISVSFLDTTRMLRGGFPLVSLLGSAIGNGVRSPGAPDREPGMIVPAFGDLSKGARATVKVSYWKGQDLISESHGDRSLLVNAASAAGVVMEIAPLIAIPAAAAAAQRGELGMLDEELLPRTALAVLMNPRTPMVVRERAMAVLVGSTLRGRGLMEAAR